ncbi:uncharacterized protein RCC_00203 [Ramularia collo-cygni]|uniref:Zn(2)-C6 fungal-type domain-containing protein n=1 Tax=Ramularia collo-cygni TaxID=112498 RepID=A0A2D3UMS1_9PEZI|nr:uncharacterized protein RCC_00203 [Ramularia collo-cygni]CZT14228.1 uncharacterized protein RCC_00203 [Ramularia collo-cygni]
MTTPASRRNGKPASCEPCRRGKIRCDHQRPICGRCQHRGITAKCFYHPAPLTKPRGDGSVRPRHAYNSLTPSTININNPGLPDHHHASVSPNTEAVQYALHAGNESDVRRSQFQDSEVNLRRQVDEIMEILDTLQHLEEIHQLISYYQAHAQVALVPSPIMLYATNKLFDISREISSHQAGGDTGAIRKLANDILNNTSTPVVVHPNLDFEAFVDMLTGRDLRLEMLGIVFTVAARARACTLPRHGGELNDRLLFHLFKAGHACLILSRELAPTVNDVMIWLSFEMTRLHTNAQGDSNPNVWRSMGDTIADAYIMELHREAKVAENAPFWLAECRRKNWATIYHWDKSVATYFQRPPRAGKRYTDCELPLDLEDHQLCGSPEILHAARNKLTSDGWNPEGAYCSSTWYRLRCLASRLVEEQWEYRYRKLEMEDIPSLEQLAERCQAVRASFPDCLQYNPRMWESGIPPSACLMLAIICLMYLHNDLQVHMMLMRLDAAAYTGTALKIACQIVGTTNHFGQMQERDYFMKYDNAYVLLTYALPAASILIPALSEKRALPLSMSRSKLIREISVFIGYLETICKVGEPNYTVCTQLARVFSGALDEILEPGGGGGGEGGEGGEVGMRNNVTANPTVCDGDGGAPGEMAPSSGIDFHNGSNNFHLSSSGAGGSGAGGGMTTNSTTTTTSEGMGFLENFDLEGWMQSVDWSGIGGEYTF